MERERGDERCPSNVQLLVNHSLFPCALFSFRLFIERLERGDEMHAVDGVIVDVNASLSLVLEIDMAAEREQ